MSGGRSTQVDYVWIEVSRMTLVVRKMKRTKAEHEEVEDEKGRESCVFQRGVETGSGWSGGASR